jgi:hypothetical protein
VMSGTPSDAVRGRVAHWVQMISPTGEGRATTHMIERRIDGRRRRRGGAARGGVRPTRGCTSRVGLRAACLQLNHEKADEPKTCDTQKTPHGHECRTTVTLLRGILADFFDKPQSRMDREKPRFARADSAAGRGCRRLLSRAAREVPD